MHLPRYRRLILMFFLVMAFQPPSFSFANWPDLTAKALKTMIDSKMSMVIVNPLSDIEFDQGHIPGSINIPLEQIWKTSQLPGDKTIPIVTYCLGKA